MDRDRTGQPYKGGQSREGYKCRRCGSYYCLGERCPARDEICGYCKKWGHYTRMCSWKKKSDADAAQRRDERNFPTTQNRNAPKRRPSPSSISSDTSAKRQKQQTNKADEASVQPVALKQ